MKSTFMTNGNLMVALFSTKTEWIKRGGLYDLYMLSTTIHCGPPKIKKLQKLLVISGSPNTSKIWRSLIDCRNISTFLHFESMKLLPIFLHFFNHIDPQYTLGIQVKISKCSEILVCSMVG